MTQISLPFFFLRFRFNLTKCERRVGADTQGIAMGKPSLRNACQEVRRLRLAPLSPLLAPGAGRGLRMRAQNSSSTRPAAAPRRFRRRESLGPDTRLGLVTSHPAPLHSPSMGQENKWAPELSSSTAISCKRRRRPYCAETCRDRRGAAAVSPAPRGSASGKVDNEADKTYSQFNAPISPITYISLDDQLYLHNHTFAEVQFLFRSVAAFDSLGLAENSLRISLKFVGKRADFRLGASWSH